MDQSHRGGTRPPAVRCQHPHARPHPAHHRHRHPVKLHPRRQHGARAQPRRRRGIREHRGVTGGIFAVGSSAREERIDALRAGGRGRGGGGGGGDNDVNLVHGVRGGGCGCG